MKGILFATLAGLLVSMSLVHAAQPITAQESPRTFLREVGFEGHCPEVEAFTALTADDRWLAQGCCKVCRKGKACGNSCISRNYTCHRPPGCACDG